ncbi:MAG: ABC transporter substrate-binding protein [Betaproteobacteria bacterium]|nr:ABC transporter substrate-binding protein [Betaproteobacteria bacterium]MCC6247060.1 ABC transporter substrate-binding protein [Rubrivivax sp.]MCL4696798.1 ABC transporter substrate-binding protein [Burkholderiaceae bacterium]
MTRTFRLPAPAGAARALTVTAAFALALAAASPGPAAAQPRKDSLVLAMTLEPSPGLDPTAGAASAIAEVTLYNVFETLTKINSDGRITPLLAESFTPSADLKTWTFKLRRGIKFHNDEPFDAAAVKFSFERAVTKESTNKDKAVFANITSIETPDPHTVVLNLKNGNPDLPFQLGSGTASIVEPKSAAGNGTKPTGTGPYKLEAWNRGASIVLVRNDAHRNAKDVKLRRVTIRFISDPAAQVAALLSGDVDVFPRVAAATSLKQFEGNKKYQVLIGGSRAKVILAMNNKRKPLDNVLVRQAISAALDRKAVIEGAANGFGVPIGSYYTPGAPGYIDLTAMNAYDPAKARAMLHRAGVVPPLELTMTLPPTPYARQGGEVIAAMLDKVGIKAKIQNVEWAQWLSGTYGQKAYDLTVIAHVEPLDFGNFARPNYYWGYESEKFKELWGRIQATVKQDERNKLMADAQRLVAEEAVAAYLYQPTWITVANSRVKGLWKDVPVFANDLAAMSWQ